jgi:hypothetical protein
LSKPIWARAHTAISEVSLSCTYLFYLTAITIRFQDDVGGLQVLSKGEWVDATPIPDTVLLGRHETYLTVRVNVADAMQFWTSDTLKSTKHRVLIPKKTRFSLVYFVVADPETVYRPFASLTLAAPETNLRYREWKCYNCQRTLSVADRYSHGLHSASYGRFKSQGYGIKLCCSSLSHSLVRLIAYNITYIPMLPSTTLNLKAQFS